MDKTAGKGMRRGFLLLMPLVLIAALMFAFGGRFGGAASAVYGEYGPGDDPSCWDYMAPVMSPFGTDPATGLDYWPAPNKCRAAPWGVNDNPVGDALGIEPGDRTIDGFVDAGQAQLMLQGGDPGNPNPGARVHIIDVRVPEEQFDGQAPCLTAIQVPTYPVTNSGHPIWKGGDGKWTESFHVPVFAGFYWAGTDINEGVWQTNIRPEPNPNFVALGYQDSSGANVTLGGYFRALKDQGEIRDGDSFVVMCQTGWRAAYAATILKNLPGFENSRVYDLHGGFRGWNGAAGSVDVPGPESGGVVIDPAANGGNGQCAAITGQDANGNPIVDEANAYPCDQSQRLRVLPGFSTDSTQAYNHVTAAATDPMIADRWAYNITRLIRDGQVPMWDGVETHIGQKPEWHTGFGAGDFKLKLAGQKVRWADYGKRLLAVDYAVRNDKADYFGNSGSPLNYYDECGGAPAPAGSCHPVLSALWGPAYNVRADGVAISPDRGVTVSSTGGLGLPILPGASGVVTVVYQVPADVTSFQGNPVVTASDIPDAKRSFFGESFEFYFTYNYSHWQARVDVPPAPAPPLIKIPRLGIAGL